MTRRIVLGVLVLVGVALVVAFDQSVVRVVVALGACYLLLRMGMAVLGSFARPVPPPPPAGELRKVRIQFRCTICGTEVRMVAANDEVPEPPRHCLEDMVLVAPIME
ncbi:MAG: hypothetical protein GEV08_00025 [Acidimicrobiia bacterium]|nr:hypothetical protein [Acidimicrobiia bacterium]